jgi:lysozyme family protein
MVDLPLDVAKDIYKKRYWDAIGGDQLPFCVAEFLFDFAVNSGVPAAAIALQHAVGALPDGAVGPKTIALAAKVPPRHILRLVFVARAKVMAHSPKLPKYENGWFARLYDVLVRAIDEGA